MVRKGGDTLNNVADRLKRLMEENNCSAYKVAQMTGYSQTAVHAWLNEEYPPKVNALKKLSECFKVPITYFLE
jgi:transcriptional regulator with XRE-family HTH domain